MIHPTKGRILVKKKETAEIKSDAGVIIPGSDMVEEDLLYGEIIDHNPGEKALQVFQPGNHVYYSKYSAQKLYDKERKEYLYIVSDLDVQAVEK